MSEINHSDFQHAENQQQEEELDLRALSRKRNIKTAFIHIGLFILTFISVSYMGAMWVGQDLAHPSLEGIMLDGSVFAAALLGFLGVHEFGHYFAARYHKIRTTLPYFIPLPLIGIGTIGAIIKIKEPIKNSVKLFDVGIAGPLAGFVIALLCLVIGSITNPGPSYLDGFSGHPKLNEYVEAHQAFPEQPLDTDAEVIVLGQTALFYVIQQMDPDLPPLWELYHYPFLFAGWLGLFFTALNLTPVGQLDGGHITLALLGRKWHTLLGRVVVACMAVLSSIGMMGQLLISNPLQLENYMTLVYWPLWGILLIFILRKAYRSNEKWMVSVVTLSSVLSAALLYTDSVHQPDNYMMWLFWLFFISFFSGVEHPPVALVQPLDRKRKILGWLSLAIYLLCLTITPIYYLN